MNKKVEFTKKKLSEAMLEIMKRKPLSEITATELCKAAGINRTTFYRHYNLPQEVFAENVRGNVTRIENVISSESDIYTKMLALCQLTEERYGAMLEVFRSGNNMEALSKPIFEYMSRQEYLSFEDKARETFIIGGVTALYNLWCQNAFSPSPSMMARLMADFALGVVTK